MLYNCQQMLNDLESFKIANRLINITVTDDDGFQPQR